MFELPKLPYSYDALEPYIDAQTMEVHHTKHHQTYVNKLNEGLAEFSDLLNKDVAELVRDLDKLPEAVKKVVRNHGGGHLNHSLFWKSMQSGSADNKPSGKILEAIVESFGSFDEFKKLFGEEAAKLFGSGWVWLVRDSDGKLKIVTTANQDNPLTQGLMFILGLDVWEHAYYLKYQSKRPDYVSAWWAVVNWSEVEKRLDW